MIMMVARAAMGQVSQCTWIASMVLYRAMVRFSLTGHMLLFWPVVETC